MIDINSKMSEINSMLKNVLPNMMNLNQGITGQSFSNIKDKLPDNLKDIDYDIWDETVKLQTDFNEKTVPNWKEKKLDWYMAILDEWVEVLNSYSWKWWKDVDSKIDFQNIEVELVDLFHFLLSKAIEEKRTDFFFSIILALAGTKSKQYIDSPEMLKEKIRKEAIPMTSFEVLEILLVIWADAWFKLDKSFEDLMKWYRVKNALNIIRQKFGYKEGKYIKQWGQYEDNVIAWEIANDLKLDNKMFEILINKLEQYYISNVQGGF